MSDTREGLGLPFEARHGTEANLRWIENSAGQTVCDFYYSTGETVCDFYSGPERFFRFRNADQHQAFIVTACNAHHDLVEALELLLPAVEQAPDDAFGTAIDSQTGAPAHPIRDEIADRIRAALAKAKGGAE